MASRNDAVPSPNRRFPPPWSVDEQEACFIVRDANGQALGYFYFEEERGRRSSAKPLSKDEARRMAMNFAKLCDCCACPARGRHVERSAVVPGTRDNSDRENFHRQLRPAARAKAKKAT
jgi:hypothetical protein